MSRAIERLRLTATASDALPEGARIRIRWVLRWPRSRWGNLRRDEPFDIYGFRRGRVIDRVYMEDFLARHATDVRGDVLEVKGRDYSRRYGRGRTTRSDVLDLPGVANADATVRADLGVAGSLPEVRYDCFVLTHTVQLVPDAQAALRNAYRTVRPGGVVLLTVPSVAARVADINDLWRWTPAGLEVELGRTLPDAEVEVVGYGNLAASIGFLSGLAADEAGGEQALLRYDDRFPVVAAARIRKPA